MLNLPALRRSEQSQSLTLPVFFFERVDESQNRQDPLTTKKGLFLLSLYLLPIPLHLSSSLSLVTKKEIYGIPSFLMVRVKLWLVRHGQTEANKAGILQGWCDYPLTELGLREAKNTGKFLSQVQFDRILSSDLKRAYETAKIISAGSSFANIKSVEQTVLAREVSFGVKEGLPKDTSLGEAMKIFAEKNNVDISKVVNSAETYEDVRVRQMQLIEFIRDGLSPLHRASHDEVKILCVTHGAFIRNFFSNFTNEKVSSISNCGISVVAVDCVSNSETLEVFHHEGDMLNFSEHTGKDTVLNNG